MNRRTRIKTGFTLLELLVVISIIAVVIGIALPSLRQAREQSRQLVCRQNLTQIWRAVLGYSLENQDRVPYMERIAAGIDPFDPAHPTAVGNVLGQYIDQGTLVCPSAVAGYPDKDKNSRWRWKNTYEFSTVDRAGYEDAKGLPYDSAAYAYSGTPEDPAVRNDYHFDGRPLRLITVERHPAESAPESGSSTNGETDGEGGKATVLWNVSVPLVADKLGENSPGDIEDGRALYPHRGVVRRQQDVYRAIYSGTDPAVVRSRLPGYFHLHAQKDRPEIFLTRQTPDQQQRDGE